MNISNEFIVGIVSLTILLIALDSGFFSKMISKKSLKIDPLNSTSDFHSIIFNQELLDVVNNKQKNYGSPHKESEYISNAKSSSSNFFELQDKAFELFK